MCLTNTRCIRNQFFFFQTHTEFNFCVSLCFLIVPHFVTTHYNIVQAKFFNIFCIVASWRKRHIFFPSFRKCNRQSSFLQPIGQCFFVFIKAKPSSCINHKMFHIHTIYNLNLVIRIHLLQSSL